jgi:predicted transposase/invertase (TIGR01784 family)
MDFYVETTDGNVFEVEMQKRNRGNIPKRTRFYQGLLDAPLLKSGEESFDHLNPTYIIVICGFDLYKHGKIAIRFQIAVKR